jgi:hypothetical protein
MVRADIEYSTFGEANVSGKVGTDISVKPGIAKRASPCGK